MEMPFLATAAACAAMGLAGGMGYGACRHAQRLRQRARHKEKVGAQGLSAAVAPDGGTALDAKVIDLLRRESVGAAGGSRLTLPGIAGRSAWFARIVGHTGLAGVLGEAGFCSVRAKLAVAGAVAGGVLGAAVSVPFAAVLGAVGCFCGFTAPRRALKHRVAWRTRQMEQHLPEMLDVVAIGMRSGLSFDRSVQIYTLRFDTMLAAELSLAEREWTSGLEQRDPALRQLAASYDSPVFARVVEAIVRSLRFGTSMVDNLETAAHEARCAYRAMRQEQVAKAPVKMMVPTGTLILPAMLIMVLGPVLLEMIGGGI